MTSIKRKGTTMPDISKKTTITLGACAIIIATISPFLWNAGGTQQKYEMMIQENEREIESMVLEVDAVEKQATSNTERIIKLETNQGLMLRSLDRIEQHLGTKP